MAVESKVRVPVPAVKVPELDQLPATWKEPVDEAVNAPLAEMVRSPKKSTVGSLVSAVTVTVFVPSPTVTLLLAVMVPDSKV